MRNRFRCPNCHECQMKERIEALEKSQENIYKTIQTDIQTQVDWNKSADSTMVSNFDMIKVLRNELKDLKNLIF